MKYAERIVANVPKPFKAEFLEAVQIDGRKEGEILRSLVKEFTKETLKKKQVR